MAASNSQHSAAYVLALSAAWMLGIAMWFALSAAQAAAPAKSLALIDCTLIDDNAAYNDAATTQQDLARVRMVSGELRGQLRERALYRVADNAPAGALISSLAASQNLNACNGCELEIGRKLGVERVGVCWVQKVSNLILNINLRVEEVASGRTVFQRSVDIRGNTDRSWQRGATALIDLLAADGDVTH
ncbi:DUF3280 domain-containing protein [Paraburkholderia solisilvae]|uniref:DUF2380 domain-containing protein n=1 Tax=Paraburkholderia solisilvae TaxID=624376 RepID=A0A6J5D7X0_9BURK|nr:hypothetical protein LMG29739_01064 [Paraburkholderia solisilvae]